MQACHCFPSLHTQWSIFKLPTVPRDAALNSRSKSRAVLDWVARKNAKNSRRARGERRFFKFVFRVFFYSFEYRSLRSQFFYPNAIKWPGRIGAPPIPENTIKCRDPPSLPALIEKRRPPRHDQRSIGERDFARKRWWWRVKRFLLSEPLVGMMRWLLGHYTTPIEISTLV